MGIVEAREIKKYYGSGEARVKALNGITLSIKKGKFVAIVGSSGSGKTTLLNMIGGLDVPDSGEVIIDGKRLNDFSDDELTVFRRRKIGFIFQQYNLLPMLNVWENIILPVKMDGLKADREYIKEVTAMLGLSDKQDRLPEVNSREWRLPGLLQLSLRLFLRMNLQVIWTPERVRMYWGY